MNWNIDGVEKTRKQNRYAFTGECKSSPEFKVGGEIKMSIDELKIKAVQEIESVLWELGSNGSSDVFPDFEIVNSDLNYGIQNEDDGILVETKLIDKNKNRIFVKVKVGVTK